MYESNKKIIWLMTLSALIIISVIIIFLPVKKALVFSDLRSNNLLSYLSVEKEQVFQLEYIHSIHRSAVVDTYKVLPDNRIQQTALQYEDMAIGMPSNALFKGEKFVEKDGKYFIENMNRIFPSINLGTSQVVVSHKIILSNQVYKLDDYIQPGSLVKFEVKNLTLLQLMRGVKMNGKRSKD
ncbi:DUF1850 domain-containing protein [Jeotgalibacillus sp. S-D1]|uniref:DUF1850 domain-containing protein n=1 Tax=Jeotgalibacillus sp. S-D1 TaxID=2552189 RepID=UPI00105A7DEC|nr:DUF1850 domain-containing protein [Jeotgalibacillus sp. S-D1]TDL35290.1 DUF1850 domain-containing protein [Jeotgalibacillus sp. S-D1]